MDLCFLITLCSLLIVTHLALINTVKDSAFPSKKYIKDQKVISLDKIKQDQIKI